MNESVLVSDALLPPFQSLSPTPKTSDCAPLLTASWDAEVSGSSMASIVNTKQNGQQRCCATWGPLFLIQKAPNPKPEAEIIVFSMEEGPRVLSLKQEGLLPRAHWGLEGVNLPLHSLLLQKVTRTLNSPLGGLVTCRLR